MYNCKCSQWPKISSHCNSFFPLADSQSPEQSMYNNLNKSIWNLNLKLPGITIDFTEGFHLISEQNEMLNWFFIYLFLLHLIATFSDHHCKMLFELLLTCCVLTCLVCFAAWVLPLNEQQFLKILQSVRNCCHNVSCIGERLVFACILFVH